MTSERSLRLTSAAIGFGAFALLVTIDIATESDPRSLGELIGDMFETGLIVASATGVALLSGSFQRERHERSALFEDLRLARAEGEAWRERAQGYLSGLAQEIEKQFEVWELTESEREVGLLMLKGFSHREIAGLRGTTEATVRHQARAAYQKSGMPGRSAFCAYFLEDLLPGEPSAATNGGERAAPAADGTNGDARAAKPPQPSRART